MGNRRTCFAFLGGEQKAPPGDKDSFAIVCGPPIMIKFTQPVLEKLGYDHDHIILSLENRMKCGIGICGRAMVHRLLQLTTQSIFNYIDAVCDLGLKPGLGEPTASGSLISARHFREFVKPYLKQCTDHIIERCGSGPTLHICGDTSRIWTDMVETGAAILSLDNLIDLEEAKRAVGSRVCLEGNVRPVDTLMKGSREQILEEAKECIRKTYDSPKGFILASGCGLPLATPPENVIALMDAARQYGRIPIDPSQWE